MNTPGLFILGCVVGLIVVAALALLTWGAVIDGRTPEITLDDPQQATPPSGEVR